MLECDYTTEFWSKKRQKYGKDIIAERANFLFLKDGSMVYDTKFDSYIDAMIDAVQNHGEDLDDIISLVFPEKFDHPIVKEKILELIKKRVAKTNIHKKNTASAFVPQHDFKETEEKPNPKILIE